MTTADMPAETVSSDDEWGLVYDWQRTAGPYIRVSSDGEHGLTITADLPLAAEGIHGHQNQREVP